MKPMKNSTRFMTLVAVIMLLAGSAVALAVTDEIRERIKPKGNVNVAGEAREVADAPRQARSGQEVYAAACQACHATGAAGAPRTGNAGSWGDRLHAEMDELYANAINGVGAMPAKGGCGDCSDEEVRKAVDHMIEQTRG